MNIAYNPTTAAALLAAPSNNDITFDLKGVAIYAKGVKFKGTDTTYSVFKKHTASGNTGGYNGLVPVPSYTTTTVRFLREDGTWATPAATAYNVVSSTANGLAPAIGTTCSTTIATQADEWVLTSTKGGTPTWRKLPANAFKNDDTNTTYTLSGGLSGNNYTVTLTPSSGSATTATIPVMTAATSSAAGKAGLVPAPAANLHTLFLKGDGTWATPSDTHWTTHLYIGAKDAASNAATTNGNTYIKITDNSTIRNQYIIKGSGITAVASDANGNITINTPASHNLPTSDINKLTGYAIATSAAALATTDTLNVALGKLEYKAHYAYNWIIGVTATDTDEYINKWSEIVEFLDSVKEGTDILDEFVTRKTALTITGPKTFNSDIIMGTAHYIYGINENSGAMLFFDGARTILGSVGTSSTSNTHIRSKNAIVTIGTGNVGDYTILHSGNSHIKNGVITINGASITPLTAHQSLANYVTLNTALTISGVKTFSTLLKFTVAQGTSPFTVTSNTKVANLNADLLDGYDSSAFVRISKIANSTNLNTLTSNLLYYTDTDGNTTTLTNAPYTNSFMMLQLQGYSSGDDVRRYRLAINGYGDARLFNDRDTANTGGAWVDILTSKNYTTWINTTNFPGLNKTGTVTSVTVTGANGLSGTGTITTSGTITLSNAGVRSVTINGNYLRVNTNGTNADLTIPYATKAKYLNFNEIGTLDFNTMYGDTYRGTAWYGGGSNGAVNNPLGNGTAFGMQIWRNASGYTALLIMTSAGKLTSRYWDGSTWSGLKTFAYTSDIPTVTNYYWANIKVSSSSSTTTTPTFATVNATTSITTPLVTSSSILTLNGTAMYLKCNNNDGTAVVLSSTYFKPFDAANNKLSLGTSSARWSALYSGSGNFTGNVTLYSASGDSPRLIFLRAELNQTSLIDWSIYDTGGNLLFLKSLGNGWETVFRVDYETNNSTTVGYSVAAGFKKSGSTDSYVLLGGGGHKALSDFMLKSEILTNNLTTISKSLTVTLAWMDTGIKYQDLPATGTYVVLVYAHMTNNSVWYGYWSGLMSWYRDGTNSSESDEIILHRTSHAMNGNTIYLRTITTASSDGRHLRLLIAANKDLAAATYTFKFKRII